MLPRFGECAHLFADIGEIVLCIGIIRIESNGLAEVFASRIDVPHFLKNASQIKVRQGVVRLRRDRTADKGSQP